MDIALKDPRWKWQNKMWQVIVAKSASSKQADVVVDPGFDNEFDSNKKPTNLNKRKEAWIFDWTE